MQAPRTTESLISRRGFVAAVAGGLGLGAAASVAGTEVLLPQAAAPANTSKLYNYVYATGKSESAEFLSANTQSTSYFAFGSSEFYISKNLVSTCPQAVLGEHVAHMDLTYIGEAYDQSLWHVIAAGAHAPFRHQDKCLIMVSPQWFFKNNGQQSKFFSKFSLHLYHLFLTNPLVSEKTRAYVARRLVELGVSAQTLQEAEAAAHPRLDLLPDVINGYANHLVDQLRLRQNLLNVIHLAPTKTDARRQGAYTGEPAWASLIQEGAAQGASMSQSNEYGVYDAYWQRNQSYDPELRQNFDEADAEYADFEMFLEICSEVGLEPLVVLIPVHGQWFDKSQVDKDTRARFYTKMRGLCDAHEVAYADFSSCEYERYFLCDTVHPGWIGWPRIMQAFWNFVAGNASDVFLGGGRGATSGNAAFGEASGLSVLPQGASNTGELAS